jgi:hypothetical protein
MNLNSVKQEPALALALLQAIIALAVSFGLDLSPEQVGAILAVAAAVAALFLRRSVTPVRPGPAATVPAAPVTVEPAGPAVTVDA